MKVTIIILVALASMKAWANLPPTKTQGNGESAYSTTFKFNFPNISVSRSGTTTTFNTVNVAGGGTGATTLTANNVILGNGTSAVQFVAPSTSGNVLRSNGTTWVSQSLSSGTNLLYTPNEDVKQCRLFFGGGSSTMSSPTECGGSPCVEIYDSCGAVSGITRASAGIYAITFSNGTWANSSMLDCSCNTTKSGANGSQCNTYNGGNVELISNSSGGGVVNVAVYLPVGTVTDATVRLRCEGIVP